VTFTGTGVVVETVGGIGPGIEAILEMSLISEKRGLFLASNGIVTLRVPFKGKAILWLIGGGMGFAVDVAPPAIPLLGGGLKDGLFPPGTCGAPDKGDGAGVPAKRLLGGSG
jgi:hypothetical protein